MSTEISELSNRELDAAVAEQVMGWKLWPAYADTWLTGDENNPSYRGWHPTEDIAEALRAYEEIRKQHEHWRLFDLGHEVNGRWRATLIWSPGTDSPRLCTSYAETPARAICLALIQAATAGGTQSSADEENG